MAYTPNTWATGDTITAAKLNHMEQGIANAGGMVVPTFTLTGEYEGTCDMTFAVVNAAVKSGKCFYAFLGERAYVLSEYYEDETIVFAVFSVGGGVFKEALTYETSGVTYSQESYPEE